MNYARNAFNVEENQFCSDRSAVNFILERNFNFCEGSQYLWEDNIGITFGTQSLPLIPNEISPNNLYAFYCIDLFNTSFV